MTFFKEENILIKFPQKSKSAIISAIAFPNIYSVGMASLGFQTAWKLFNQNENLKAVRWFTDIQEKSASKPEFIGFSFSWELDYKNIFYILEKNNIPIYSKERKEEHPIVFAGGQVPSANCEPFCENFDFFLIGDLEIVASSLTDKIVEIRNLSRIEKLNELSKLPGIYVPSKRDIASNVSFPIKRQSANGSLAHSAIITPNSVWPNTLLLEIVRSCPELCRFCLASYGSLPFRTPNLNDYLIPAIDFGLAHTDKIGLLGASVTQHPRFEELIDYLLIKNKVKVQVASVRADTVSEKIAEGLFKLESKSITMAVESGSERLREIINKKVSNETIIKSIETIFNAGFSSIKLYGMVGLPFETLDDIKQTIDLLKEIKLKNKTKKISLGCSVFVPKAGTPFQWFGVDPNASDKLDLLGKELHQIGVDFRPESYRWATIQALISRGDKSIHKLLERAYRLGSTLGSFNIAIKETAPFVDSNKFIFKNWAHNSQLPWQNIQGHLGKEMIQKHINEVLAIANV